MTLAILMKPSSILGGRGRLTRRQLRGLDIIARGGQILRSSDSHFLVKSQSGSGQYHVSWRPNGWTCSCDDWLGGVDHCKHVCALHSVFTLPLAMLDNAGVVAGEEGAGRDPSPPLLLYGRSTVGVRELVLAYRQAASRLADLRRVYPVHPLPPRIQVRRVAGPGLPGKVAMSSLPGLNQTRSGFYAPHFKMICSDSEPTP